MKPLFSLLFLLHLPQPSLFYSLKNCSTDSYDQSKFICSRATSLSLIYNGIHRIRQTDLCGFTRLKDLDLGHNNISNIEDGAFSDLSALTSLTMSFNQLTNLTQHMFKGLFNVSRLDLSQNKIGSISKFNLYLDNNKLTSLQSYGLSLPLLKVLHLAGNNLSLFEAENLPFVLLNLTKLDLRSNPLRKFSVHSDVFPRLRSLDLSFMSESVIEWDVPDKLFFQSLIILDLDWTNMTIETYQLLFQIVDSVKSLDLRGIGRFFDKGLLDFACGIPSLRMLYLQYNDITVLNNSLLQSCANLTELDLSQNSMTDLAESSLQMLTRLTRLTLEENKLSRIPVAIRNMTNMKFLHFDFNKIKDLGCSDFLNLFSLMELTKSKKFKSSECWKNLLLKLDNSFDIALPSLHYLHLTDNNIAWLHKGTFVNVSSLSYLNLKSSAVTSVDRGAFEGLHNLKDLYVSTNMLEENVFDDLPLLENLSIFLQFPTHYQLSTSNSIFNLSSLQNLEITVTSAACLDFSKDVFKGLENLRTLKLHKVLCFTPDQDTFHYTPHLIKLQIENNLEFEPVPELFIPLTELELLRLFENKIKSLNFLFEANLTKLKILKLNYNELTVINETVFEKLPSLKYLDLSGNPFVCDCSNAGFIEWTIRNKQVQVDGAYEYRCSSPSNEEGHFLLDFNVRSCWEFTGFLYFISSSALVLLTLLSSFIFHFLRWQLVYGYYLLQAFLYNSKKRRQGCPHIYDAFVSYNVHDEYWVYGELLHELEERQGWKLCLHHRDFIPGRTAIIENITDAIYSSRKTLCVISRRYLQSEWCSREIQLASFRLFDEHKDVLILLFLEEISSNQLSPFYRMRKLVKSRTYLSWTQARSHKGLFWEKVRRALECGHEPGDNHNPLTANA
uniref:TIR domain-containing protein n=1 Tax=Neogobius melanostomus TaxID=47308 RepID=A0A8C6WSX0_9GOBI